MTRFQRMLRLVPTLFLVIGSVVASIFAYFGILLPTTSISLVLALFAFVALQEVVTSQDLRTMDDKINNLVTVTQDSHSLVMMGFKKALENSAEILDPAIEAEYIRAFSGFRGNYLAFNPIFTATQFQDQEAIVDKVFIPRYNDPLLSRALFLIFVNDKQSEENFRYFRTLMLMVAARGGTPVTTKLEIKLLKESYPSFEYYVGQKVGGKVALLDFDIPYFSAMRAFEFLIRNHVIIEKFEDGFYKDWSRKDAIPVDMKEFFSSSFDISHYLH